MVLSITKLKQPVIRAVKSIQQGAANLKFKGPIFLHPVVSSLVSIAPKRQLSNNKLLVFNSSHVAIKTIHQSCAEGFAVSNFKNRFI